MLKLVLVVAVVYGMPGRMLYLAHVPGRTVTMTPADIGLTYQDVSIETAGGVTFCVRKRHAYEPRSGAVWASPGTLRKAVSGVTG